MHQDHTIKSRIAPTPSGLLHPGNGLSFLLTWAKTRAADGQLLLRIDDMDKDRCRPEYVEDIFETLDWLGIDYDEGPSGPDDFTKHWSQFKRMDLYVDHLNKLRDKDLLFACDCSRKQQREDNTEDGRYGGRCLNRGLDFDSENTAWRVKYAQPAIELKMKLVNRKQATRSSSQLDRFLVRQKNKLPAYQLSSLVDDVHYGINYIVRGEDLLSSSWSQLYLANLLGLDVFSESTFLHHPLLLDEEGLKLSKSKGAGSLKAWRENGQTSIALVELAAKQLGVIEEVNKASDLVDLLRYDQ